MPAEHESDTPRMQPETWKQYLRLSFTLHRGQQETFDLAMEDAADDKLIVLPTGYGKTRAAAGYYAISRERHLVNRCLWLVSSDLQRLALSPEPDKETGLRDPTVTDDITTWFGLSCLETMTVKGDWREIRMHERGDAEVFVTSYQFLREQATYFNALLGTGQWLLVADEAHHLRESGKWADWLERLPRVGTLYMSATPLRTDRLPLKNVPRTEDGTTFKARVNISARAAIEEQAIRKPLAHAQDWKLEFADNKGELVSYTTSQLRELGVDESTDFDAWVVKHDLKYTMAYLQRIVLDAVVRLTEKCTTLPGTHQMIVYAMSCQHAKFLANHVFPSIGYETKQDVDWIGVLRSEAENREVISKYKKGELLILVQVDKAGEGFDNPASSVGLFLNMVKSDTKLLQQIGRLMRRLLEIAFERDVADIFADTSHQVIPLVRTMHPEDDAYDESGKPPGGGGGGGRNDWDPLPELMEIKTQWLNTDVFGPDGTAPPDHPASVFRTALQYGMSPEQVQDIVRMATGRTIQLERPSGEIGKLALMEGRVTSTMRRVATHAITLSASNGIKNPRQLAGWIKKNLNTRWKVENRGHKEMLSEDFERKYEWLRKIDEEMRQTREVPQWLIRPT